MSGNFIGRTKSLGWALEATRGTAVAPTYWVGYDTTTVLNKTTKAMDDDSYGRPEINYGADVVELYAQGTVSGSIHDKSEGTLLKNVFGSVASVAQSAPNTAVYDHTFSVSTSAQKQSITLATIDSNENLAYASGVISKYEIDYALNKYIQRSFGVQAFKSAAGGNTAAMTTENKFRPQDVTIKLASSVAGLSGATASQLRSLMLVLEQGVQREQYVGDSTSGVQLYNTTFKSSLNFELLFPDTTFKDYVFNNTAMACSITMARSDVTIGTSANPGLVFTFQPGYFTAWNQNANKDALVTQTADFTGIYSLSAPGQVGAVLTNLATSYA